MVNGSVGGRKRVEVKESQDDDIFTKLPDGIVNDILSLIPTKDLARTSVLSKRWRCLWTYSTNIVLHQTQPPFIYSVEQVLLHCRAPYLEKVTLSSGLIYFASRNKVRACRIRSWVSSALHHRVQELDLILQLDYDVDDDDYDVMLPPCLFTSNSLTALKLYCSRMKIPSSSICLPNLKKLHLLHTIFLDEQSTQRFFSGLPALEVLVLDGCDWSDMRKVTINCPSLKSLTFSTYVFEYRTSDWEINIYASNLSSLHCTCSQEFKLVLHDMESLVDAFIVFDDLGNKDNGLGFDIFRKVHRAKSLTVSQSVLKILQWAHIHDQVRLPMFYNLNRLVVHRFDYKNVEGFVILLQRSPNLEFLEMAKGMVAYNFDKHDWSLISDPLCFKSSLKKLRIRYFYGDEVEIYFIKFMLKNVPLLEIELIGLSNASKKLSIRDCELLDTTMVVT